MISQRPARQLKSANPVVGVVVAIVTAAVAVLVVVSTGDQTFVSADGVETSRLSAGGRVGAPTTLPAAPAAEQPAPVDVDDLTARSGTGLEETSRDAAASNVDPDGSPSPQPEIATDAGTDAGSPDSTSDSQSPVSQGETGESVTTSSAVTATTKNTVTTKGQTTKSPSTTSGSATTDSPAAGTESPVATSKQTTTTKVTPSTKQTTTSRATTTTTERTTQQTTTTTPSTSRPTTTAEPQTTTTPQAPSTLVVTSSSTPATTAAPTTATTAAPTTTTTTTPTTTTPATTTPPTTQATTTTTSGTGTGGGSGGRVIWEENFNSLDTSTWSLEHSTYGDGNNELQCYRPENVSVSGGKLILQAVTERYTCPSGSTREVTSGMIRSKGVTFSPGQAIEFRVKLNPANPDDQAGLWPAVWASGWGGGGWPRGGELDWLEVMTAENAKRAMFSMHYADSSGSHELQNKGIISSDYFSDAWHTIRFDYGRNGVLVWYLDGKEAFRVEAADTIQGYPAPFDQTISQIKINLALGGRPGPLSPNAVGSTGATFEMDFIRILEL